MDRLILDAVLAVCSPLGAVNDSYAPTSKAISSNSPYFGPFTDFGAVARIDVPKTQ